jgi:hypothetical protein
VLKYYEEDKALELFLFVGFIAKRFAQHVDAIIDIGI